VLLVASLVSCGSQGVPVSDGTGASTSGDAETASDASAEEGSVSGPATSGTESEVEGSEAAQGSDEVGESTGSQGDESTTLASEGSTSTTDASSEDSQGVDALAELEVWLGIPWDERPELGAEPFASIPLTRDEAETARDRLWTDRAAHITATRQAEVEAKAIELDGFVLRYETVVLGAEPPGGRSLFISMHGGGSAPAETNDEQWRNQIALAESYMPQDALWVAPRAPADDWNMWFQDHIDPMFDRLITNMIVFEGVDPNRVYLNGYSAGGDGVYQLGPRMADRFAAAGMSAGHPNDAAPDNLRNLAFAIHVGGDDTAFSRNEVAAMWGTMLDALQAADPEGYPHQVEVHPGLPHWMNLADQVSIPFMQSFVRSVAPSKVVWLQPSRTQGRFYWLRMPPEQEVAGARIEASIEGQSVFVTSAGAGDQVFVRLSDDLLDLDQPVAVTVNDVLVAETTVPRTIAVIHDTLAEREDPAAVFTAEVSVPLDPDP